MLHLLGLHSSLQLQAAPLCCKLAGALCRGLALLKDIGVVSASHDLTLRVWSFEGECIAELIGHTALVYSAACSHDSSLIASASEDNTVRTWRPDGQCLQTLEHPGMLIAANCTSCHNACGLATAVTTCLLCSSQNCSSVCTTSVPAGCDQTYAAVLVTLLCST